MVIFSTSNSILARVAQIAVSLGPILVPEHAAHPGQSSRKAQRKNLAAGDQLHPRIALPSLFQQEPEHGGSGEDDCRSGTTNLVHPRTAAIDRLSLDQVQTGAEGKRQENFQTSDVEGDRGPGKNNVICLQHQVPANTANRIGKSSMGDAYSLWLARRTRGIDHVGDTIFGNRSSWHESGRSSRGLEIIEIDHAGRWYSAAHREVY